ncbi:ABC-type transport system involved in multi-copper enzyme maturation permease subunit [Paenarthrobacter nicotinovorans]|uniref:hypothetical protein n=1 Tax=Micrococcaceae TaxID=1268 RepID=UPI000B85D09A|nr:MULTISPECIES: hypothetical protein [Micrococcaceae]MDR6438228.1 ABC-type transport system involved in multi-copper enzyme maturation permease subunit [Paenarthrobacter nicotinovorans]
MPASSNATSDVRTGSRTTMMRAVRAETTKLLTLRLCLNTMAGTVLLTVLLSWILTSLIDAAHKAGRPDEAAGLEAGTAFLVILHYGQIGVILLAAWSMHQESDTGSLRSTLISLPQRSVVLAAKAIVIVVAVFVTAVLSVFGSAGIRCVVIDCTAESSQIAATPQAGSGILWGVVLYWILIALFTYALSVVLRSGLAAMGTVLAMALIVSTYLVNITPFAKFLPDQAGAQLYQLPHPAPGDLGPATGGLVLAVWVVAALIAALVLFRRQPVRR